MVSSGEERSEDHQDLASQAVSLAMEGKWKEAAEVNRLMLERFPLDVEAYNRLGRSLIELGDYVGARESYSRALEIAPHNGIAKRNLERLSHLGERPHTLKGERHPFAPDIFVKESGKAGIVKLESLAPLSVLSEMTTGEEVYLRVEENRLRVFSGSGDYLGCVEPKHEARLVKLMSGGNQYAAAISSLGEDQLEVIIRETYQDPSQAGRASFMPEGTRNLPASVRRDMPRYEVDKYEIEFEDGEYTDPKEDRMEDLGFHQIPSEG